MNSNQKQQDQSKRNKKSNKSNEPVNSYARYTGIAIQMVAIIVVTTLAGVKLDSRRASDTPVFTIILSLLGVFAAIYTAIKDFIKK